MLKLDVVFLFSQYMNRRVHTLFSTVLYTISIVLRAFKIRPYQMYVILLKNAYFRCQSSVIY